VDAHAQNLTGVVVEVPATSRLGAPHRQVSLSPGDASPASDDGNVSARIASLEKRQDMLERQQVEMTRQMQDLDRRLKELEE